MPTLKLTGGKPATRTAPTRSKPAAKRSASKAPARKQAQARKPAAVKATASENGSQTRGPKLPEGWTKQDFNRIVKDMQKTRAAKVTAAERLSEAQEAANQMALDLISEGIQMSVVSKELELSRQWLYNLMENLWEKYGFDGPVQTERQQAARKPARRTAKPAAKKAAAKPAARKAPARKPPAAKKTARTAPATRKRSAPRGRVRLAA